MGEGKPAGRQPNILKPLLYETLVYSTPTPTSAPTLFVSWCIYVIHFINCFIRNKTWPYTVDTPFSSHLHAIFFKNSCIKMQTFMQIPKLCFSSFLVQPWPLRHVTFFSHLSGDTFIITHFSAFSSKLIYTQPLPTTILHVLPTCETVVWAVPDCWLSAHLPKQDPNPMTSLEAQITLTSLPGWHTNTTHQCCSYSTEKPYTHFTARRKMEDWSQQQKTCDRKVSWKTKSRALSLKHAHIKYRRARCGWGEKVAGKCERTVTDRGSPYTVSFD